MTGENRSGNAGAELAAARDALRAAEALLSLGLPRDALSRAYYAAFHAARALVVFEGTEPRTHAGLARLFSSQWVSTGKIERRFNLVLTRLRGYREASDYGYSFDVDLNDVSKEIVAARDLVDRAEAIIQGEAAK